MTRFSVLFGILVFWCSVVVQGATRQWTDSTGVHKVQAELVDVRGEMVRLKKSDGALVDVPLERLCEADQRYVELQAAKAKRNPRRQRTSSAAVIEAALKRPIAAEFIETPLDDVVGYLRDAADINIYLDVRAMDDVGISSKKHLTLNARNDLASVLDSMVEPLELTWIVRDDVLQITTPEEAESGVQPRVYCLHKPMSLNQLTADITANVEPKRWDKVGGPGTIEALPPNILVIAQNDRVHRSLVGRYRNQIQLIGPSERFPIYCQVSNRLKDALFEPIQVDFVDTPLKDIIAMLRDRYRIPITLDRTALDAVGIGDDVPITASLENVPLKSGLALLLQPLDLAWTAKPEGIRVTTPEAAEAQLELVSYRVDDLVTVQQLDALFELITSTVSPTSWNHVGGPGSIRRGVRGTLDIRQVFSVHMRIARLLEDLRRAKQAMT